MLDPRTLADSKGLRLSSNITAFRPEQVEAIKWARSRPEPYLFINAPTGSGKTLLLGGLGLLGAPTWTYCVHTIRLQNQVSGTFLGLPVLTGRRNHPCEIGLETHGQEGVTADVAICAAGEWCEWSGRVRHEGFDADRYEKHQQDNDGALCSYYASRAEALRSPYRVANYAYFLADSRTLRDRTGMLLCDEAHNIEDVVCDNGGEKLYRSTYARLGLKLPKSSSLGVWASWAQSVRSVYKTAGRTKPDMGIVTVARQLSMLRELKSSDQGEWLIEQDEVGITFSPIWGAPLVMPNLLGHSRETLDFSQGIRKAVFSSATLMGAEFIAEMLGFPDGSWAYLDMPGVFPSVNRPINYAPIVRMNAKVTHDPAGRKVMQDSVDNIIERYVLAGHGTGLVHAVSNFYRDCLLRESRWGGILTSDPEEHTNRARAGKASVLVAANLTEGWDGIDELCRFVIMPKVPYASLTDKRIDIRRQEDARTYDYKALVSVVQGAGRGMRHENDFCDTWILDEAWRFLFKKRRSWLPASFMESYHHEVSLAT